MDHNAARDSLSSIFPDLESAEIERVIQRFDADLDTCIDYITTHSDSHHGARGKLLRSNDPRVSIVRPAINSEDEAKTLALVDLLAYQENILQKAKEEQLTQNFIAAMQLEEDLQRQAAEERRRQEQATLELLEQERLLRQQELENKTYECPICLNDSCKIIDMYTMDFCDHRICLECMKKYIEGKIQERAIAQIPCPMHPCTEVVGFDEVKQVLPMDLFERFDAMLLDVTLSKDPSCRFCPRPGCGTAMLGDSKRPLMICPRPGCKFAFCFTCREAWHSDATCEQYQLWKTENTDADSKFQRWAAQNTKPCPRCFVPIEKNGGCNHHRCTNCNEEYCWLCLGPYDEDGHACPQFS